MRGGAGPGISSTDQVTLLQPGRSRTNWRRCYTRHGERKNWGKRVEKKEKGRMKVIEETERERIVSLLTGIRWLLPCWESIVIRPPGSLRKSSPSQTTPLCACDCYL